MAKESKKPTFQQEICVTFETDSDCFLIAGDPQRMDLLVADDGDFVATYRLVKVSRLRTHPRLE